MFMENFIQQKTINWNQYKIKHPGLHPQIYRIINPVTRFQEIDLHVMCNVIAENKAQYEWN